MLEMRLSIRPNYSVRTRVIEALRAFPATVRELEGADCGSSSSIRRVLRALAKEGGVFVLSGRRYGLREAAAGYKMLESGEAGS